MHPYTHEKNGGGACLAKHGKNGGGMHPAEGGALEGMLVFCLLVCGFL